MARRKIEFANNEYYHIFNRGVDKRDLFLDTDDFARFFQSMAEFNTLSPIGSILENSFRPPERRAPKQERLVNFICYCLNPNHYHFVLEQVADNGIKKFMHKIGGYSKYFNRKYKRSGALFQGKFRAVHINSNEQLLHTSVYVNLNDKVHRLGCKAPKSSWGEYIGGHNSKFCEKGIILGQFNNEFEYKGFAEDSLREIRERRDMEKMLLE